MEKTNSTDNSTIIEHKIRHYEDHPGISHIKLNLQINSTASRLVISQQDIEKTLKALTTEKPILDFCLDFFHNQSTKV